jgi:lysozyme
MKSSDKIRDFIKSYEKCKLKAYRNDPKEPWTIGWGNTYYEDGSPVKEGDTIAKERADSLFQVIIKSFDERAASLIKTRVEQSQFDAVVSFAYNCGLGNLRRSTLLKKVNANPSDPTIEAEFLKWISKGTKFENGLRKRRQDEADIYFGKK